VHSGPVKHWRTGLLVTCVNTTYAKRCFNLNYARQMILILEHFCGVMLKSVACFLKKRPQNLRGSRIHSSAMML